MKKAIVYFANGTEECEGLIVVDLLRRAGVQVVTASVNPTPQVLTSHKLQMNTDAVAADLDTADADLLVLPGGIPGTPNLAACPAVVQAVKAQNAAGKRVAAICAAPSILADLGLLHGKKATVHPSFADRMGDAAYCDCEVVTDGSITTGSGLGAAIPFGLELVRLLTDEATAQKVRTAIVYRHE